MADPHSWQLESDDSGTPAPRLSPVVASKRRRSAKPPSYQKGWDGNLDSWDLEDPNYSDDAWYTASRGADKTSRQYTLRLPEYIAEALDQIVAAKVFPPVRTVQDFIRSSVVHELHRRIGEIQNIGVRVEVSAHTDLAEINALRAENEAKRAFVLYCKEELETCDGNPAMMRKVLELVWAALEGGQYDGALYAELDRMAKKYSTKPRVIDVTDRAVE